MNHQQHYQAVISMSTWDLLKSNVLPIPAKQPINCGRNLARNAEKMCLCCGDIKPQAEFSHAVRKDGSPRLERRIRVCNECMKSEEGREMNTYKVKL